jgi:hypothetical protein
MDQRSSRRFPSLDIDPSQPVDPTVSVTIDTRRRTFPKIEQINAVVRYLPIRRTIRRADFFVPFLSRLTAFAGR